MASSHGVRNAWIISVCLIVIVAAGLIVSFYGDDIATFVRYRGSDAKGNSSIVAIACIDAQDDASCDNDKGRVADVGLILTQANGTKTDGRTDANGLYRFDSVSTGTHSLLVALPFPGRVTATNPIAVVVPAQAGITDRGSEVTVFIPVALTGESSMQAKLSFIDPHTAGALIDKPKSDPSKVQTVYPGQRIGVQVALSSPTPIDQKTTLTVVADFDDACIAQVDSLMPPSGKSGNSTVTWSVPLEKARSFNRTLSFDAVLDKTLPEIDPLLCETRVTLVSADGVTIGTTAEKFQVIDVPTDHAVLEMTTTMTDNTGGAIKAGDELTFVIGVRNIGSVNALAKLHTDLPAFVTNPVIVSVPNPQAVKVATTGGENGTGFIEVNNLTVVPTIQVGEQVTISYKVTVAKEAKTFDVLKNYATLTGAKGAYVEALERFKVGQVPVLLQAL